MANTLAFQEPVIYIAESQKAPLSRFAFAASGHTGNSIIRRGDIVAVAAGVLARAAANANSALFGLAAHGELEVFAAGAPAYGLNYDNQLFGPTQETTATSQGLLPAEPGSVHVNSLLSNQIFEISGASTVGWVSGGTFQANIGTTGGIAIDATTQQFIFDPNQANKVMTIYNVSTRTGVGGSGLGGSTGIGDLAPRLLVFINTGAV